MKILLCYTTHADPDAYHLNLLPTGLVTMHAMLRQAGHDCRLANLSSLSRHEARQLFRRERPALVGISLFTHNRFESLELAALVKRELPSCVTVCGGPHASHRWEELLGRYPAVDLVVVGEGEETVCAVAAAIAAGADPATVPGTAGRTGGTTCRAPERPVLAELDLLPPADLDRRHMIGVDLHRQMEFLITSRGCPASCTFCASPRTWGKRLRFHSPAYIVAEIRRLRDRLGLIYFSIRDDTFTADRRRVLELCRLLLEEKVHVMWNCQSRVTAVDEEMLAMMKRAGCECVQFGIETGSPSLLRQLRKSATTEQMAAAAAAVRRVGINLSVYLISGIPGETAGDLRQTEELVTRLRPHDGQVSPLVYYPGTELYAAAVRAGMVPGDVFESGRDEAVYALPLAASRGATRRLMSVLARAGVDAAYTAADFRDQKKLLGYCHTTSVMAGESCEAAGDPAGAGREYGEIVRREPGNPWGWLKLGELHGAVGRIDEAVTAFRRLAELVPAHVPAYLALGELEAGRERYREARRWFRTVLDLDPGSVTARQALAELGDGTKKGGS